ncbi:hypothetical protein BT69DRAFT_1337234 [Atractiella rhizophila]|nr:hypothetical protein BT69DRAFT_1337234 [Atractiella rhizophila]
MSLLVSPSSPPNLLSNLATTSTTSTNTAVPNTVLSDPPIVDPALVAVATSAAAAVMPLLRRGTKDSSTGSDRSAPPSPNAGALAQLQPQSPQRSDSRASDIISVFTTKRAGTPIPSSNSHPAKLNLKLFRSNPSAEKKKSANKLNKRNRIQQPSAEESLPTNDFGMLKQEPGSPQVIPKRKASLYAGRRGSMSERALDKLVENREGGRFRVHQKQESVVSVQILNPAESEHGVVDDRKDSEMYQQPALASSTSSYSPDFPFGGLPSPTTLNSVPTPPQVSTPVTEDGSNMSGSRKRTSSRFSPSEALHSVIGAVRTRRPSSRTRTLSGNVSPTPPPIVTSLSLEESSTNTPSAFDDGTSQPSSPVTPSSSPEKPRRQPIRRSSRAMSIESNISERSRRSSTPLPTPAKLVKKPKVPESPSKQANSMIRLGLGLPSSAANSRILNDGALKASAQMKPSSSKDSNGSKSAAEIEADKITHNRAQALSILEGGSETGSSIRGTLGDSDSDDNDVAVDDDELDMDFSDPLDFPRPVLPATTPSPGRGSPALHSESGLPIAPRVRRRSSSNRGSNGKGKGRELAGVIEVPDWARVSDFIKKELGRGCLSRMSGVAISTGNLQGKQMRRLESDEKELWSAIADGVVLVRLLTHIAPYLGLSDPDRRDLPMARRQNIISFVQGVQTLGIRPQDRFQLEDLEGRRGADGWDTVLRCLLALEKWCYEQRTDVPFKASLEPPPEINRDSGRSSVEFPRSDDEPTFPISPRHTPPPPHTPSSLASRHSLLTSSTKMVRARNSNQEPSSSSGASSRLSWERSSTESRPDSRISQVTATTSAPSSNGGVRKKTLSAAESPRLPTDYFTGVPEDREFLATSPRRLRVSIARNASHHASRSSPYSPPTSPTLPSAHSPNRPSPLRTPESTTGPSVTFAPEVDSPPSRKNMSTRIYGDRRMSESAIDILTRVDESDEGTSANSSPKRNPSEPKPTNARVAVPKRAMSMSPPVINSHRLPPSPLSNFKFPSIPSQEFNEDIVDMSTVTDTLQVERPLRSGIKTRLRHSSDLGGSRPTTPSPMSVLGHNRSSSSLDRGRVQSLSNGSPSASRSHSPAPAVRKKASSNRVPFPRAASESPNPSANGHSSGRERLESRVHHVRPRQQHKRWNSELYMDLPLASAFNLRRCTPVAIPLSRILARHEDGKVAGVLGRNEVDLFINQGECQMLQLGKSW